MRQSVVCLPCCGDAAQNLHSGLLAQDPLTYDLAESQAQPELSLSSAQGSSPSQQQLSNQVEMAALGLSLTVYRKVAGLISWFHLQNSSSAMCSSSFAS